MKFHKLVYVDIISKCYYIFGQNHIVCIISHKGFVYAEDKILQIIGDDGMYQNV